jgi:Ca-activated chloride channel family protein
MKKRTLSLVIGLLFCLALLFSSAFTIVRQENSEPVIRVTQVDTSHFPRITVYISVTDAFGNPLGIDPDRLVLSENSQAMIPIQVAGSGQYTSLTTMLVMDVSGSMDANGKLDAAKAAALAFIDEMRMNDQTGVMSYNTKSTLVLPFTHDKAQLRDAIHGLTAGGDTSMFDATLQAEYTLEAQPGRKAILLLTDGLDNHSHATARDVLNAIGSGGLSISIVGLGNSGLSKTDLGALDEDTLRYLAKNAGGTYTFEPDPQELAALYTQLGQALQSELAITYISPSVLHDGLRREIAVSLATTAGGSQALGAIASYNPGGLIPEVANRQNWGLFAGLLAPLVLLAAAPSLISLAVSRKRQRSGSGKPGPKKKSRITLK